MAIESCEEKRIHVELTVLESQREELQVAWHEFAAGGRPRMDALIHDTSVITERTMNALRIIQDAIRRNPTTGQARRLNGVAVKLSRSEFDLLARLAAHSDQIQSREALFRALYRREYDGVDRMLDISISRLRRKLGGKAENAERIKTIWGQGYLFVADAW